MLKKGLGLLVVLGLAGLGLAQTTANHTVNVQVPSVLKLSLDATGYLFNFTTGTGTDMVNVGSGSYRRATRANYEAFLDTATSAQNFAPTSVAGTGGADYGTLTVHTNRAQWTVSISVTGDLSSPAGSPLTNSRVKVFAQRVSGKGSSLTTTEPTPITSVSDLIEADSAGAGKSVYRIYYLLTLHPEDEFPSGGYDHFITVSYTLTSP